MTKQIKISIEIAVRQIRMNNELDEKYCNIMLLFQNKTLICNRTRNVSVPYPSGNNWTAFENVSPCVAIPIFPYIISPAAGISSSRVRPCCTRSIHTRVLNFQTTLTTTQNTFTRPESVPGLFFFL